MREWTTFEGLKNFGTWFKRTRYDSSVWPSGLKIWFRGTTGFETKLTQQELCEWLSVASDDETISDCVFLYLGIIAIEKTPSMFMIFLSFIDGVSYETNMEARRGSGRLQERPLPLPQQT